MHCRVLARDTWPQTSAGLAGLVRRLGAAGRPAGGAAGGAAGAAGPFRAFPPRPFLPSGQALSRKGVQTRLPLLFVLRICGMLLFQVSSPFVESLWNCLI